MIIELKIIVDCSTFSQWLAVIELEFSYGSIDTWEVYVAGRCVWGENQRLELFPPYDLRQFFTATIFHHYFPQPQALLVLPEGNLIPVPNCRLSHSPLPPHNIDLNSHFTCVSRSSLSLSSSSSRATVRLSRLYYVLCEPPPNKNRLCFLLIFFSQYHISINSPIHSIIDLFSIESYFIYCVFSLHKRLAFLSCRKWKLEKSKILQRRFAVYCFWEYK